MRGFLWQWGRDGYTDEVFDATAWDAGVRPWPTMDNLCEKGLIRPVAWWGPEDGHEYRLTDLGRDYMRRLVDKHDLPKGRTLD